MARYASLTGYGTSGLSPALQEEEAYQLSRHGGIGNIRQNLPFGKFGASMDLVPAATKGSLSPRVAEMKAQSDANIASQDAAAALRAGQRKVLQGNQGVGPRAGRAARNPLAVGGLPTPRDQAPAGSFSGAPSRQGGGLSSGYDSTGETPSASRGQAPAGSFSGAPSRQGGGVVSTHESAQGSGGVKAAPAGRAGWRSMTSMDRVTMYNNPETRNRAKALFVLGKGDADLKRIWSSMDPQERNEIRNELSDVEYDRVRSFDYGTSDGSYSLRTPREYDQRREGLLTLPNAQLRKEWGALSRRDNSELWQGLDARGADRVREEYLNNLRRYQ